CTVNSSPYASPLAAFILQSQGMPSTLGLTNWSQDINPRRNGGYPTILGGAYPDLLETLPVTDTTAVSAKLYAIVDVLQVLPENCSEMGFEYKLQGTATYTSINCALDDTFSVVLGGLLSCTTYTVRPYLTIDAYKVYGDTLNFTTLCMGTARIDTTRCYGDTLHIFGEDFYPDGTYYKIHNNTTYTIDFSYHPARHLTLDTIMDDGDTLFINNQPYTTSGVYVARFSPDGHGCDSIVYLSLRLRYYTPSVWDGMATPWSFGDGTAQNPYLIENAAQLAYMSSEINNNAGAYIGAYFDLVADIDLNGYNWTPIGTSANQFQGYFNGNDHTIDNLNISINGNSPQYVGLFGYVSNGEISNVHIIGEGTISVRGTSTTFYIGSIAGYANSSTIDSCSNQSNLIVNHTGTTTSYNTYLGGLVGYLTGNTSPAPGSLSYLTNSMNQGKINFNITFESSTSSSYYWRHYIGGIAGRTDYATLENCGNLDSMFLMNNVITYSKNSYIYAGGITGYVYGTSALPVNIKKNYNKGKIILNNLAKTTHNSYSANAWGYIGGITGYCS
ncbi:MAG TPA: hypothetical protein GXZ40_09360, partial [Bacteroidales bacterium]|nr:hypothetical protein [Bacteroidales bacterium]